MHAFVCTLFVRTASCSNHVFQHMKCVTCWFRSYVMRIGLHTPHTPTTRPSRNPSLNEHFSTSSPDKTNVSLTFPGGSSSSQQQQHHHQQQRKPDANAEHLWKEACYASMLVQVGGGRSSATMWAVSGVCHYVAVQAAQEPLMMEHISTNANTCVKIQQQQQQQQWQGQQQQQQQQKHSESSSSSNSGSSSQQRASAPHQHQLQQQQQQQLLAGLAGCGVALPLCNHSLPKNVKTQFRAPRKQAQLVPDIPNQI